MRALSHWITSPTMLAVANRGAHFVMQLELALLVHWFQYLEFLLVLMAALQIVTYQLFAIIIKEDKKLEGTWCGSLVQTMDSLTVATMMPDSVTQTGTNAITKASSIEYSINELFLK